MKIDDAKIEAFAKRFRQQRREVEKACRETKDAVQATDTLAAEIDRLGEPDYRDDAAIEKLAKLQLKMKAAERAVTAGKSKEAGPLIKFESLVIEGVELSVEVLAEIAKNRLETVTSAVRMFSRDAHSAMVLAEQSDACRSARQQVNFYRSAERLWRRYQGMYLGSKESPEEWAESEFGNLMRVADTVERVLFEATDKKGNLMRLLPMFLADPHAPTSDAKAGADVESDEESPAKSETTEVED